MSTLLALVLALVAHAGFLDDYAITGAPGVGVFRASNPDNTSLDDKSFGYGGFATGHGSLVKSADYRRETSDWSVVLSLPITIDYGLEAGYFKFPHAQLFTARPLVTLFKLVSIGAGGYLVQYEGKNRPGYGLLGAATVTPIMPLAPVRPYVEARVLSGSLRGTLYSVGVVIGRTP